VVDEDARLEYMQMVGAMLFVAYQTRPDIAFACSQLGGVLTNPGPVHLVAAKRVIRYLAGTKRLGLLYSARPWHGPGFDHPISATEVVGYTDADWAGCHDDRKSTSCYLTFFGGGLIGWRMHKQQQNAMSSAESELIAMSGGARDIEYVRNTLGNMGLLIQSKATVLMSDSSAAISIADKLGLKEKTKHIALRYFQMRGLQTTGVLQVRKIGTDFNPSDIGTKALGPITFSRHARVVVGEAPNGHIKDLQKKVAEEPSGGTSAAMLLAAISVIASGSTDAWSTVRRRKY
jgi:hypothetical protein